MFRTPTTIIVGAGASKEYGLPIGDELKAEISQLINIKFDHGQLLQGDHQIVDCLRMLSHNGGYSGSINHFLPAARNMAEALPLALSIDNYLEAHQADENAIICGKLGIARAILKAEQESSLFGDPRNDQAFDLAGTRGTWIAKFMQVATENVAKDERAQIFQNVSIVSFNYDRCIAHFVVRALKIYYALEESDAIELANTLRIFHPYGSLGKLYWQKPNDGHAFGSEVVGQNLIEISKEIKTFGERVDDEAGLNEIKDAVANSQNLIFLGFGFHRQNIELLQAAGLHPNRRALATVLGISMSDREIIETQLQDAFRNLIHQMDVHFFDGTCADFFSQHSRMITA